MSDSADAAFFSIISTVVLLLVVLAVGNASERSKCESLQKQGVKVYVAEGLFTSECVVVHREVVP